MVTCQHVLTARHCVAIGNKNAFAYGYKRYEILSPQNIRVGLGSAKHIGVHDPHRLIFSVQQIRAAESRRPDLAVLVLRDSINPTWPRVRPAMIFRDDALDPMRPGDIFIAIGWGEVNKHTAICK